MHRAVLTPKRLISNLFAIRPYIVKVTPLTGIAAGSLLPVDFGHGQFTRLDRDFILQKTILSRQLWKQTARCQFRPPPRAHPRALAELRHWEQGSPHCVPLLHLQCRAQVTPRGLDGEGLFPPSRETLTHRGGPQALPVSVAFGDSACPLHGPHAQCPHRLCSRQDGGTAQRARLACHPCKPLTGARGLFWKSVVPTLRHFP